MQWRRPIKIKNAVKSCAWTLSFIKPFKLIREKATQPFFLMTKIAARWEWGRPRACCLLLEVGEDGGYGAPAVLHCGAHPGELSEGLQQVQVGVRCIRVGKLFLYNE